MEIEIGPELRALLEVVAKCVVAAVVAVAGCGVLRRFLDYADGEAERWDQKMHDILNHDPDTWRVETTKQEQPK